VLEPQGVRRDEIQQRQIEIEVRADPLVRRLSRVVIQTQVEFVPIRHLIIAATLLLSATASPALAQQHPSASIDVAAGWVGFADDGIVSETMFGGGVRWYVSPRVSVGPEVIYIAGDNHSHYVVTGNVTFDLLAPNSGGPRVVTPFVVAGGGLFQTSESFASETFRSSEGAFTAGGGVRIAAGDHVTFGIDARIGWETHLRVNALVGIRF
jgi:hypothetical protein